MAGQRKRMAQVAAGLATTAMIGLLAARALHGGPTQAGRLQDNPLAEPTRKARAGEQAGSLNPPPALDDPDSSRYSDAPVINEPPAQARKGFRTRMVAAPATLDPAQETEEFVARTAKEARERIAALDKEAGELKARLAKIEAASARLKSTFGNLVVDPDKAAEVVKPVNEGALPEEPQPNPKELAVPPPGPPPLPEVPKAEG